MIEYSNKKVIEVNDWNKLVRNTYNKPYHFQQQEGCRERGIFYITIPSDNNWEEEQMNNTIPEEVNGEEMGVKFQVWLDRDPEENSFTNTWENDLFWERNFYPNIYTLANDLFNKGLIEKGKYLINIDW